MSNSNSSTPQGRPQLPTPEQAYSHLFDEVHARAFFGKLAAHGRPVTTDKQAADYLELAGKLRMLHQDPAVKAAAEADGPLAEASAALDQFMAQNGFRPSGRDVATKQAAVQLAADPAVYASVLALKAAEAGQVAAAAKAA